MTSFSKALGRRVTLSAALFVLACQNDSSALFDNSDSGSGATGSGATGAGGSKALAGSGSGASSALGGSSADAGKGGSGQSAGDGGTGMGGKGEAGGNTAGKGSAGDAGMAGDTANGGTAGTAAGMAGAGGTKPDPIPDPITLIITDFEDSYIEACDQFTNHGSATILDIDANDGCTLAGLMQPSLAELPDAAIVSKAELALTCTDEGDLIHLLYVSEEWTEANVRWSNRPDVGADTGVTVTCSQVGVYTLDLTAVVKAWLAGTVAAHGVYLGTESNAGTNFATSEAQQTSNRPKLTITYTLPVK